MGRAERRGQALFNAEEQVPEQIEHTADQKDADPEDGEFIAPWDTAAPGIASGVIAPRDAGKEQGIDKEASIEDGVPRREEGLIHFPMRVGPAVHKDPSYPPGFKKNHNPIKFHTTLRKFM